MSVDAQMALIFGVPVVVGGFIGGVRHVRAEAARHSDPDAYLDRTREVLGDFAWGAYEWAYLSIIGTVVVAFVVVKLIGLVT